MSGPACPPPQVRIVSWNGNRAVLSVRTGTTDPVTVRASFLQRLNVGGKVTTRRAVRSTSLAGETAYRAVFTAGFTGAKCGFTDVRTVRVSTSPAGGSASRAIAIDGPSCPSPSPKPQPEPEPEPKPSPSSPGGDGGPVLR